MTNNPLDKDTREQEKTTCPCCGQTVGIEKKFHRLSRAVDWFLFLSSGALLAWTLYEYL